MFLFKRDRQILRALSAKHFLAGFSRLLATTERENGVLRFMQLKDSLDGWLTQDDPFAVETVVLPARVHANKVNDDAWLTARRTLPKKLLRRFPA